MTSTRNKSNTAAKTENSSNILRQVMFGKIVSSDFFARNWVAMLIIVSMILAYTAGKYTCQTKMEQVRRLTSELEIVRAERIRAKSEYMGKVRESAMQKMVDELNLGLTVQEFPPYVINEQEEKK
ncbi:MAG: FtsL-like putative cell division protein [Bacteroides sp.]|nr:FtsL-like putative cell division protein [Bacteroides sp.]MCM1413772.1 FtsL-like putative cell division protein [Bacteroides sp.]MCM1472209.1 FtsL-like putative cell division protein [Bacteroides sp.]